MHFNYRHYLAHKTHLTSFPCFLNCPKIPFFVHLTLESQLTTTIAGRITLKFKKNCGGGRLSAVHTLARTPCVLHPCGPDTITHHRWLILLGCEIYKNLVSGFSSANTNTIPQTFSVTEISPDTQQKHIDLALLVIVPYITNSFIALHTPLQL